MQERFQFLKTYADTLTELAKADENLAKDLAWKIIQYGIYDEDAVSDNPIIEAIFIQIKLMIDNGKAITDKNRENGMKGGRPKNPNKTQTKPKQNPNKSEEKPKKTKIENRKKKIENNLITSNDVIEEKSSYGNEDINECLEIIKSFNGGMIDGTQKWNRIYGKNLINKLSNSPPVVSGDYSWQDTLKAILQVISQNKYHRSKIASPKTIYDNLTLLFQVCNEEGQTKKIEVL